MPRWNWHGFTGLPPYLRAPQPQPFLPRSRCVGSPAFGVITSTSRAWWNQVIGWQSPAIPHMASWRPHDFCGSRDWSWQIIVSWIKYLQKYFQKNEITNNILYLFGLLQRRKFCFAIPWWKELGYQLWYISWKVTCQVFPGGPIIQCEEDKLIVGTHSWMIEVSYS